ncbi:MAG: hypothetical protein JXA79_05895 [Deltaproteobacteria bacterium]|nr:hypothetical protein [Deltaproteobacteria bacterium]
MLVKATGRSKIKFALAFMVMVTMFSAMWGCGGGGGDFKTIYPSSSRLLSVETLKSWIDAGKVNSGSYDNVVILDVNMDANQHIPGAQKLVQAEMYQTRIEGVAATSSMILSGAAMDNLIKGFGINLNTTIVFTGSSSPYIITRAYFTFRYWGFPKEQLFILNGLNPEWEASYPFTDQEAVVTASEFSVRDNEILGKDLRYSLGEMIAAVEEASDDTVIVDMRGPGGTYDGTSNTKDYVVLGHPKGAKAVPSYKALFEDYDGGDYTFIDPNDLRDIFEGLNLSSSKNGIMYCTSGNLASLGYFILEGILNWPAAVYDGSWKQWGLMSDNADKGGSLPPAGSGWAVDDLMDPNTFVYAKDTYNGTWADPRTDTISPADMATFTGLTDPRANQIEKEDAAYMAGDEAVEDTGADDAGAASDGGGSCG